MPPPQVRKEASQKEVDANEIRDAIRDRTKRKRPDDGGFQMDGRTMTAAESSIISEEEYEEYRRNKMARSDDPLSAMQALERAV